MRRIREGVVEVSQDEQILGDFYLYLKEERGMSEAEALTYLKYLPWKADRVLQGDWLTYLNDGG